MTDLTPDFAIGDLAPMSLTVGAFHFDEDPHIAIASLALRKGGEPQKPFGISLPSPGQYQTVENRMAIWSGQDQWLILSETTDADEFISQLKAICVACSVTQQTDGWVVIDIGCQGNDRDFSEFIARLVNIDPNKLQIGQCTRTLVHHLSCHIIRTSENTLRILGARSAARSLWHAIETIAQNLTSRSTN